MGSFETKFLKKQFVNKKGLQPVAERASPFVALCDKPHRGGSSVAEPAIFSGPQGFSYSLTAAQEVHAQDDRGASMYDEWVSPFGRYFGEARISSQAVAGGKSEPESYLRQLVEVIQSAVKSYTSIAARKLLGPVGQNIGRIQDLDEGGARGEIQLTIAGDALNFVKGMIVQAADGSGDGAPSNIRALTGVVSAVYPNADVTGTSTSGHHVKIVDSDDGGTTLTNWADNDYLFRNGDVGASDLSDAQIRSYQSWITLVAATGTKFNVDRGQDGRYSGFRLSASQTDGMSVLDRCQLLATTGNKQCGALEARLFVMGPSTWQQLAQEVQSYGRYVIDKHAKAGVSVLTIFTVNGESKVICDPHCLESDIWLFTESDLKIYTYDGFPALDDYDGNEMLRQTSAAAYTVRWHAFSSPTINGNPWHSGRCNSGN